MFHSLQNSNSLLSCAVAVRCFLFGSFQPRRLVGQCVELAWSIYKLSILFFASPRSNYWENCFKFDNQNSSRTSSNNTYKSYVLTSLSYRSRVCRFFSILKTQSLLFGLAAAAARRRLNLCTSIRLPHTLLTIWVIRSCARSQEVQSGCKLFFPKEIWTPPTIAPSLEKLVRFAIASLSRRRQLAIGACEECWRFS